MDYEKLDQIFGDDYQVPGQLSIFDLTEPEPQTSPMVAVSKVFASAVKQMSLKEWKTFICALTQIRWTEQNPATIRIDKWRLVDLLGIKSDPSHVTENLRRDISKLPAHSLIVIADKDRDCWESGTIVKRIGCYKDFVRVTLDPYYMPLFQELDKDHPYITMWADDLFSMTSERSILIYEDLRLHSDTTKACTRTYGVRDLKQLFGIPKDGKGSYMRKDGHFNRPAFEQFVLDPICDDLKKCKMLHLTILEDGKPYRKVKYHGRVVGYELCWTISDRPGVVTAEELPELMDKLNKDPKILKIAKDIATGDKKEKAKKQQKAADPTATDYAAFAASQVKKVIR